MLVSPLMFFPLFYVVLAVAMAWGGVARWRASRIHGWQLGLSLLLKVVPIAAFGYAWWWSSATRDDVGAYFMFAATAVAATVLGIAWFFFDLLGLGVWRREAASPQQQQPRKPGKKPGARPAVAAKPKSTGKSKR